MTTQTEREQRAVEEFRCPSCEQPKGSMCVYTPPKAQTHRYAFTDTNRAKQQALRDRVGTPTKRVHQVRMALVHRAEMRALQEARDRIIFKKPSPGVVAYREEQTAEYFEMQAWLRKHHGLFFTIKR